MSAPAKIHKFSRVSRGPICSAQYADRWDASPRWPEVTCKSCLRRQPHLRVAKSEPKPTPTWRVVQEIEDAIDCGQVHGFGTIDLLVRARDALLRSEAW